MGNESYGDIRTLSPEEHWAHFARSWVALRSYTYLGKATPLMDAGVERETMPLRRDMRNSTGGIMAAPLCIAAPEPWWRDDQCVPAPVTMSYSILDPARDVKRIEVLREVISVGRQMGFSRSRVVDFDDHDRVIALSIGSGVSLGDVPPGFEPVDNPITELDDSADLPPLRDVFGVVARPDGGVQIDKVTPQLSSPHSALHLGPINIALEAAAIDELDRVTGTRDFQVEAWNVMMVKPGYVGPFVARASVVASVARAGAGGDDDRRRQRRQDHRHGLGRVPARRFSPPVSSGIPPAPPVVAGGGRIRGPGGAADRPGTSDCPPPAGTMRPRRRASTAPGPIGSQKANRRWASTPARAASIGNPSPLSSSVVAASTPPVAMNGIGTD